MCCWGKLLSINDTSGKNIGAINPFRYRGYYYDTETGLYYLQSRYYDPNTGRFLNADDEDTLTATPMGLTDKNVYSYCDNNPVMRADEGGHFWHIIIGAIVGAAVSGVIQIASNKIEGKKWNNGLGMAVAEGALSGMLAATGAGFICQFAGNAAISAGGTWFSGGSKREIIEAGAVGGLSGLIGGRGCGKLFKSQSKRFTKRIVKSLFKKNRRGIWKAAKYYYKNTHYNYRYHLFKSMKKSTYVSGGYSIYRSFRKRFAR